MAKGNPIKAILSIAGSVDPSVEKSISTVQKKFGGLKSITAAAGVAFTAAAGAAVAFGASAVKAATGFETSMANVATLLDGTQEEIAARNKQLGDEAIKISSKLGLPYEELTGTVYNVISAFGDLGDEVPQIAELAAKGAKAGGSSVVESFNLLSAVTKAYGDTSYKAQKDVSDFAFMTVKLGQTTYPELATAIQQVASLSNTMGVKQKELFGVFATLTGVTGNASVVATQYKAALSNLMVPTTQMKEVIDGLGYSSGKAMLEEMGLQRTLETLKIAVGDDTLAFGNLFSSVEAKNAVLALVGENAEDFAEKTGKIANSAGITEEAYSRATDTLQAKMDIIKSTLNGFKIQIGQSILPVVKNVAGEIADTLPAALDELKPVLEDLFSKLQSVIPYIGKAIKGIVPGIKIAVGAFVQIGKAVKWFLTDSKILMPIVSGLVAGFAAFKAVGKVVSIFNGVKTAMAGVKTGMMALNAVMAANPIGLVIAGVVALGAVFVLLYKKCEPFRNFVNAIGAGIKTAFFGVLNFFKNNWKTIGLFMINPFAGAVKLLYDKCEFFRNIVNNVGNSIKNIFSAIGGHFSNVIAGLSAKFPALGAVFDSVRFGIEGAINGIKGVFNGLIQFVNGVFSLNWSAAWQGVKNAFGSAFAGLSALVKTPLNAVIALVNSAIGKINSISVSVPEWVPGLGGKSIGFNIPQIPMLARGGFTNGVSIAGEAGTEAVISFNRKYHDENVDTWLKAGRMLGASENPGAMLTNNYQTTNRGGDSVNNNKSVSMGGITFSPNITIQGNAQKDDVIKALESVLPDFYDILNRWKREQEVYAF